MRNYGAIAAYVARQIGQYFRLKRQGQGVIVLGDDDGPTAIVAAHDPVPRQPGRLHVPFDPEALAVAFAFAGAGLLLLAAFWRFLCHLLGRCPNP